MKKALSLVLALVMVLTCVSSMAFAASRPASIEESSATWCAEETVSGTKTYHTTLSADLIKWAIEVDGGVTFTLLKDVTGEVSYIFPNTWTDTANHPITVDLGGHCITNSGTSQVFLLQGNGNLTIKNGSIIQENTARAIGIGYSSSYIKDANNNPYKGIVTLENLFLYGAKADANAPMIESKYNFADLTLNNAYIWSANTLNTGGYGVICFENATTINTVCNNSIIGGTNRAFKIMGGVLNLTLNNSVIANNTNAMVSGGTGTISINGAAAEGTGKHSWQAGSAQTYGNGNVLLPNGVLVDAAPFGAGWRMAYWGTATFPNAPETTTAAEASIMAVTYAGPIYFKEFTSALAQWASAMPGGVTLYLLKDTSFSAIVEFPKTMVKANPVVIDLNGHTLTRKVGASGDNLVGIAPNGNGDVTIKNGTYIAETGKYAIYNSYNGTYDAKLTLENLFLYSAVTDSNAPLIITRISHPDVVIRNSIIWGENTAATSGFGSFAAEYGEVVDVTVENSIINGANRAFKPVPTAGKIMNLSISNSAVVILASSGSVASGPNTTAYINGGSSNLAGKWGTDAGATSVNNTWGMTLPNDVVVSGKKASIFGTAPTAMVQKANVILMTTEGKVASVNPIEVGKDFELPAPNVSGMWSTLSGEIYAPGDVVTTGMVLYPVPEDFVFIPDADRHVCSAKCISCDGCLDADCDNAVCAKKCMTVTLKLDDVKAGHWYKKAVEYVYHEGIMEGVSKTSFGADQTVSRALVISTLWNMAGKPTTYNTISFSDVAAGQSYTEAVRWADGYGIALGNGDGEFNPNAKVTREELAAFLYRYAKYMNMNISASADLDGYVDAKSVSAYAVDALKWANGAGIINGKDGKVLDPTGDATRAELAKMLMQLDNM